jgi:hypothetical protein
MTSAAVATAIAATVLAAPTAAWARYSGTASAALSVTADVLAPPTSVTFSTQCSYSTGKGTVTVDWRASSDAYANSYTASLTAGGVTASSSTVSGHNTTETTLSISKRSVAYTVSVVAGYRQWTSTTATASGTASC